MDAIEALLTRNSIAQLTEPAPTKQQMDNILNAALRANDHRRLRPWKFLVIKDEARTKFGELILSIALQDDPNLSVEKQKKLLDKPLRAPLIVVVVASIRKNEKVPDIEQMLSAGASAQLMMLAAHAQGVGAIWRTGDIAFDSRVITGLGLNKDDCIVGFLYMGTPKSAKPLAQIDVNDFVEYWNS